MVDSAAFNGDYKKNPLILGLLPHRSSESPSTEKKYPSDPYSFPTRQEIPDISKHTSPCFPVLESYFIMREMTSCVMNMLVAMQCMSPTNAGYVWIVPHFNVVQRGNLAVDIEFSTAPTDDIVGLLSKTILQIVTTSPHLAQ